MNNPSRDNVFGVIFFRFSDLIGLSPIQYFNCLRAIVPLLMRFDSDNSTRGFYINYIPNPEGGNSVRLTYFTADESKTEEGIKKFLGDNSNIGLFNSVDSKHNNSGNALSGDIEEELRFRMFSNIYTHIGLDLLDLVVLSDFLQILARYMSELLRMVQILGFSQEEKRIDAESFFSEFFNQHSNFFKNNLSNPQKEQLWKDLAYCPAGNRCFFHWLDLMFCSLKLRPEN